MKNNNICKLEKSLKRVEEAIDEWGGNIDFLLEVLLEEIVEINNNIKKVEKK